ncbi:MAG: hypothetical protein RR376_25825 [Janthinobacterium sp.]|mgnify:CR=1 FL=1|uniref:hypothetical protein n=1 Tax=Janthinobacterium sp. TND4EL3 TaxID=1907311 RepID=UPI000955E060|nr:hypothetical protein [Janthinobacterium sp. TND4EL3]SIR79416.1 hypothetical protein SAMN05880566_12246 [Janthinobacterium sp. TND4EL3]
MSNSKFMESPFGAFEEAAMPYLPEGAGQPDVDAQHRRLDAARRRNERALMAIDGVEGVSLGQTAMGREAIVVYLRDSSVKRRVPPQVEGYPVETSITGQIDIQRW